MSSVQGDLVFKSLNSTGEKLTRERQSMLFYLDLPNMSFLNQTA